MRIASQGSSHERRLIHEGYLQKRALKRFLRNADGLCRGRDAHLEILNFELGADVIGLTAIQALFDRRIVTLVTAPGVYFDPGRTMLRASLDMLALARAEQGRRTIVVSKHQIGGQEPFDLKAAIGAQRSSERRRSSNVFVVTGRRPALQPFGIGAPLFGPADDERAAPGDARSS